MLLTLISLLSLFIVTIGVSFFFKGNLLSFRLFYAYFFISFISSIVAFSYKLDVYIEILWIVIGCLGILIHHSSFKIYVSKLKNIPIFYFGILLFLFVFCCFAPFIVDHYSYYVPSIKILDKYGLFSGVSNLNWSYGQMSFTHIFQATFNDILDTYMRSNALLIIFLLIYIYERKSNYLLLFIPFLLPLTNSPSPDLLVFILSLMLANEVMLCRSNYEQLLPLSALLFISKPSAFVLLFVIFTLSIFHFQIKKIKSSYFIFSLFILLFYVIKNIFISGTPFFPLPVFIADVYWKPNEEILKHSYKIAQTSTFHLKYSLQEIESFSYLERFIHWISFDDFSGIINFTFTISILCFFIYSIIKKKKMYLLFSLFFTLKLIFIFLYSGQFRFLIDIILIIALFLIKRRPIQTKYYSIFSLLFSLLMLSILISLGNSEFIKKNIHSVAIIQPITYNELIKPASYHIKEYTEQKIGNLTVKTPKNYSLVFDLEPFALSKNELKFFSKINYFPQLVDTSNIKKGIILKKHIPHHQLYQK